MKSFDNWVQARGSVLRLLPCCGIQFALVFLPVCLGLGRAAHSQAAPAADAGGMRLSAGGTASGYELGYGQVKIAGASVFVDTDTLRHFGFEGEARWLMVHLPNEQKGPAADETASTYMAGVRYSRYYGRLQPYAKGLVGFGEFNYPYNLAKETDLVIAPGGGFDYRLTNRIRWRAVDFEYQIWPQFHYGQMSSYGLSTGIRIKIR
ncbi:MAG: outer membrane beta-barrel protein [Terracidiphilus sp.]